MYAIILARLIVYLLDILNLSFYRKMTENSADPDQRVVEETLFIDAHWQSSLKISSDSIQFLNLRPVWLSVAPFVNIACLMTLLLRHNYDTWESPFRHGVSLNFYKLQGAHKHILFCSAKRCGPCEIGSGGTVYQGSNCLVLCFKSRPRNGINFIDCLMVM